MKYYILKDKEVVEVEDFNEWSILIEKIENKIVGKTDIEVNGFEYNISTVFLGIDHGFYPYDELPLVFETMIISKDESFDKYTERYSTYDRAETGHMDIVKMIMDTRHDKTEITFKKGLEK